MRFLSRFGMVIAFAALVAAPAVAQDTGTASPPPAPQATAPPAPSSAPQSSAPQSSAPLPVSTPAALPTASAPQSPATAPETNSAQQPSTGAATEPAPQPTISAPTDTTATTQPAVSTKHAHSRTAAKAPKKPANRESEKDKNVAATAPDQTGSGNPPSNPPPGGATAGTAPSVDANAAPPPAAEPPAATAPQAQAESAQPAGETAPVHRGMSASGWILAILGVIGLLFIAYLISRRKHEERISILDHDLVPEPPRTPIARTRLS